jgi:hypothetical protein
MFAYTLKACCLIKHRDGFIFLGLICTLPVTQSIKCFLCCSFVVHSIARFAFWAVYTVSELYEVVPGSRFNTALKFINGFLCVNFRKEGVLIFRQIG